MLRFVHPQDKVLNFFSFYVESNNRASFFYEIKFLYGTRLGQWLSSALVMKRNSIVRNIIYKPEIIVQLGISGMLDIFDILDNANISTHVILLHVGIHIAKR